MRRASGTRQEDKNSSVFAASCQKRNELLKQIVVNAILIQPCQVSTGLLVEVLEERRLIQWIGSVCIGFIVAPACLHAESISAASKSTYPTASDTLAAMLEVDPALLCPTKSYCSHSHGRSGSTLINVWWREDLFAKAFCLLRSAEPLIAAGASGSRA